MKKKIRNLSVGVKNIGISEAGVNAETTTDNGLIITATVRSDYVAPSDLKTLAYKDKEEKVILQDKIKELETINADLTSQITDLQLALVKAYENIGG